MVPSISIQLRQLQLAEERKEGKKEGRKIFQLVIIYKTGSCLRYPRLGKTRTAVIAGNDGISSSGFSGPVSSG